MLLTHFHERKTILFKIHYISVLLVMHDLCLFTLL